MVSLLIRSMSPILIPFSLLNILELANWFTCTQSALFFCFFLSLTQLKIITKYHKYAWKWFRLRPSAVHWTINSKISPTSAALNNKLAHLFAWIIECCDLMPSNGERDTHGQPRPNRSKPNQFMHGKCPPGNIVHIQMMFHVCGGEFRVCWKSYSAKSKYVYNLHQICISSILNTAQMGNDANTRTARMMQVKIINSRNAWFAVKCSSITEFIAHVFVLHIFRNWKRWEERERERTLVNLLAILYGHFTHFKNQ